MAHTPSRRAGADPWDELRWLAESPYVILDTETTGLLEPEIVSIALVDDVGRSLLHEFVLPAKPIEPGASRITGITVASLAGRPAFPIIAGEVARHVSGKRVVIYNAAYDLAALANTHRRYGLPLPLFEPWCAMEWFARVYGQWDSARAAYVWQPLRKAATHFGIEAEAAHDALADCLTTYAILREAMRRSGLRSLGMDPLL